MDVNLTLLSHHKLWKCLQGDNTGLNLNSMCLFIEEVLQTINQHILTSNYIYFILYYILEFNRYEKKKSLRLFEKTQFLILWSAVYHAFSNKLSV